MKRLWMRWATDLEKAPGITHYMQVDGHGLRIRSLRLAALRGQPGYVCRPDHPGGDLGPRRGARWAGRHALGRGWDARAAAAGGVGGYETRIEAEEAGRALAAPVKVAV
jgi:hypothetical protein